LIKRPRKKIFTGRDGFSASMAVRSKSSCAVWLWTEKQTLPCVVFRPSDSDSGTIALVRSLKSREKVIRIESSEDEVRTRLLCIDPDSGRLVSPEIYSPHD
jgi:hypothetical protein